MATATVPGTATVATAPATPAVPTAAAVVASAEAGSGVGANADTKRVTNSDPGRLSSGRSAAGFRRNLKGQEGP